jgi:hypothetical protein
MYTLKNHEILMKNQNERKIFKIPNLSLSSSMNFSLSKYNVHYELLLTLKVTQFLST